MAPVTGLNEAVNSWRGPLGADQDFQMGATCIEVKTSTAGSLDRLAISTERQLEVPADVVLILVGLSLDSRVGHGETLTDMVQAARNAAFESGCLHLLVDRLEVCGYENDDANLYAEIGYTVRSFHPFRVVEGFPRIVSGDLQTGVSEVHYLVSTASCGPFQIRVQQPDQLLEGLV